MPVTHGSLARYCREISWFPHQSKSGRIGPKRLIGNFLPALVGAVADQRGSA